MTDEGCVRAFARHLGCGQVYGPYGPYQPNRQPFWMWVAEGDALSTALALLEPHLVRPLHHVKTA